MARVLIAWELGEAFGHLARCLQLAEGLVTRGHAVTLVLKDVRLPRGPGLASGVTILPAPLTPRRIPARWAPVNYADVLNVDSFADAQDVAARLCAWRGVLALVQPDVVVADHAPTALLAARLGGIPHLAIGNGFAIPPAASPWPSIRPWDDISRQALVAAESRLDTVIAAAQRSLGFAQAVCVRDLFGSGANHILDTFAELDHQGERPAGHYVGPIVSVPKAMRVDWQGRGTRKILAYLRPSVPGFAAILQALARLDAEVLCVAPGMNPGAARQIATRRLRIALAPVDLSPLLKDADLAIGYGGGGFSTEALLAGVPLALRPRYVEQALLARRIETLGAGKLLGAQDDVDQISSTVQDLLGDPVHRQAARAFRDRHRHFSTGQAVEESLSVIERTFLDDRGAASIRHRQETQEPFPTCLH